MQALLGLGPGMVLSGIYDGTWALVDMVFALLDEIGPSDVTVSAWTFKNSNVNESMALASSRSIKSLRFLCDLNFCEAHPKLVTAMRARYGSDCVIEWRAHSKFICFTGARMMRSTCPAPTCIKIDDWKRSPLLRAAQLRAIISPSLMICLPTRQRVGVSVGMGWPRKSRFPDRNCLRPNGNGRPVYT